MILNRKLMTLDEFTIQQLRSIPAATGELSGLLRDIGLAAKRVNVKVNQAGLVDILGDVGKLNIQGEDVKKLDEYANHQFINVLEGGINCAGVGSEENDEIVIFNDPMSNQSKYVLLLDPLDGSGNIDVNVSIGTIFSVCKRISLKENSCDLQDFLQPGLRQVAAGYIIYGSSTILVYATRRGVNGFTLDPSIGEFCLSHRNIECPEDGKIYSTNQGNYSNFEASIKAYLDDCNEQNFSYRYIGSMVADVHRNLLKGGIFMYPGTLEKPQGKLRLQYECNPMAFILEVAGGMATNGQQRILEIEPVALHQRTPLFIGSKNMVKRVMKFMESSF
ncbi:MAG: class 1 fructose-bisphosphatase [Chitinophagaceae bacterium]